MNTDKLTTYLGLALAALHQVGVVGTVPQTRQEWTQTGMSLAFILLGYLTNKNQGPGVPPAPRTT